MPWELVTTMILDSLVGGYREKHDRLALRQAGEKRGKHNAEAVHNSALYRVIKLAAVRIWNVEPVVHRMQMLVEVRNLMKRPMNEILVSVKNEPVTLQSRGS